MGYKLNIRGSSSWENLLIDSNIEITDTAGDFTATTLDGVLAELADASGGGGGGVTWSTTSVAVTASADKGYFVDTTSSTLTVTLPDTAEIGDQIYVTDYAGTFGTNACTIARNGHKIMGLAEDFDCDFSNLSICLVYADTTQGWRITAASDGNSGGNGSGITWSLITGNTTAIAGYGFMADVSSSAITVTLPASPSMGNDVSINDFTRNAATNNITVARNGKNILGVAEDFVIDIDGGSATFTYSDATNGWVLTQSVSILP